MDRDVALFLLLFVFVGVWALIRISTKLDRLIELLKRRGD